MINLLEGVPGSGKSYEAVVYHVLPALKMGRKVITNLPLQLDKFAAIDPDFLRLIELRKAPMPVLGRWDAEAANRGEKAFIVGDFDAAPHGVEFIEHRGRKALPAPSDTRLFGSVWDFYDEWRGEGNIGALFVIDECHVSFPKENIRKGRFTPDEVIQYFKISRHFGVDVLLMTQRMRALEEDVAGLAEMHIRVRKAAFLGRPDHYIRKVFAGLNGGEVQGDEREYKPQFFGLYKSHTQGAAVIEASASDVAPSHLKWQRASRICLGVSAIGFVWLGFKIFGPSAPKEAPKIRLAAVGSAESYPLGVPAVQHRVGESQAVPAATPVAPVRIVSLVNESPANPEPLATKGVHFAGCMAMGGREICAVTVSNNGVPVFTTTHIELEAMGYKFRRTSTCSAVLSWEARARAVICDSPQISLGVAGVSGGQKAAVVEAVQSVTERPLEDPQVVTSDQLTAKSQWQASLAARNEAVVSSLKR